MQQSEQSLEWWRQSWETGNVYWYLSTPHKYLVKYFDRCVTGQRPKVLIPLIGNTVDAKWLYDKGCDVTGVEISELAIKHLYDQHNIPYTSVQSSSPDFTLYQNSDHRIKVYAGDFYKFSREVAGTQFDFIWDRGSFNAINFPDRDEYVAILKNVLAPSGSILLAAVNYDSTKFGGPPHYITKEHVDHFFGDEFTVQLLDKHNMYPPGQNDEWGISLDESAYLMRRKNV